MAEETELSWYVAACVAAVGLAIVVVKSLISGCEGVTGHEATPAAPFSGKPEPEHLLQAGGVAEFTSCSLAAALLQVVYFLYPYFKQPTPPPSVALWAIVCRPCPGVTYYIHLLA